MADDNEVFSASPTRDCSIKATFRLLVPANSAGSIIGQKGEFIKKIKAQCKQGAYLRVPEMPHSSERLVLITCEIDDIPNIIKQLCKPIFKALREDAFIPDEHQNEILLLVNSQQAGRLVGKGGEKLKDIRVETGCKRFKIYKDRLPFSEERVCEIKGEEDSVALAVQTAMEILCSNPVDHAHLNYTPLPDLFRESGDWGGYQRFAANMRPSDHQFSRGNDDRNRSTDLRSHLSSSYSDDLRNMRISRSDVGFNQDRIVERDRSPLRAIAVKTKDIYIDDCYTRHVIGSKGSVIDKIRRNSGADVQVAKDDAVQNGERKISIAGRQSDIDMALKLINEAIAAKIKRDQQTEDGGSAPVEQFDYVNELFDKISSAVPFQDINNNDSTVIEDEVMISNSDTATIIGTRGSRIKSMRQYTKCDINVQNDKDVIEGGDQRKVSFRGTPRQVHRAMYMVQNIAKVMK